MEDSNQPTNSSAESIDSIPDSPEFDTPIVNAQGSPSPSDTNINEQTEDAVDEQESEAHINEDHSNTKSEKEKTEDVEQSNVEGKEGLRRRKNQETPKSDSGEETIKSGDGKLAGVLPDGHRFYLPKTRNPLTMKPISEWTPIEWVKNASLLNVLFLLFGLPTSFFVVLFLFWRLAYNVGLGYLLHKQSNGQYFTKLFKTIKPGHAYYPTVKKILELGMDKDYDYDKYPDEFNAWVAFRYIVDIILANDLVCYFVFCLKCWEIPSSLTFTLLICYVVGLALCFFTLWAKTDAYRVVKDFAWYWGDFFFLVDQNLTFDRVFSISPHPMYTIGYSFFYGTSLITQSYAVLYVSLIGHFCQFAFLSVVENPHIEKTYPGMVEDRNSERQKILYDTQSGYFRRDLIVFKNFDPFRSSDLFVFFIIFYALSLCFLLDLPASFYIGHAIFWRIFHNLGLGYILREQSERNFWTDHFLKLGYTKQFAFENWKKIYNMSLLMTHISFVMCCWKFLTFDFDFYGQMLLKQTAGLILIAVNIWSSVSVFEVLGEFGWFYGDFFIDEVQSTVYYTGIYRFVNNPDSVTGFAAYYGLALFTNNYSLFALALFSQALNQVFIRFVEEPHMAKVYGNQVRNTSGFQLAISEIVNEAVEQSPHLRTLKDSASEIEAKAKEQANKLKEKLATRANTITAKVKNTLGESTKGRFPC